METPLLTPDDLAERWNISSTTLKKWRWSGRGPKYVKIGRGALYRLQDIEKFEEQKLRCNTSQTDFNLLPSNF